MSNEFRRYRRKQVGEYRPYVLGEDLTGISVGEDDKKNGSPKAGDMIGRDPNNWNDKWLVNAGYFEKQGFEEV